MSHFDFDAELADSDPQRTEPVTFTLGGRAFHCVNPIPVGAMLPLMRATQARDGVGIVTGLDRLLRAWIVPVEHAAFDDVLAALPNLAVLEKLVERVLGEANKPATPGAKVAAIGTRRTSTKRPPAQRKR